MPPQESQAIQRLSNISGQMTSLRFNQIPLAPPDAIFGTYPFAVRYRIDLLGLTEDFKADKDDRVCPTLMVLTCIENYSWSWRLSR